MNKDEIIELLDGWNSWNKDQETGIYREEYLERLFLTPYSSPLTPNA